MRAEPIREKLRGFCPLCRAEVPWPHDPVRDFPELSQVRAWQAREYHERRTAGRVGVLDVLQMFAQEMRRLEALFGDGNGVGASGDGGLEFTASQAILEGLLRLRAFLDDA